MSVAGRCVVVIVSSIVVLVSTKFARDDSTENYCIWPGSGLRWNNSHRASIQSSDNAVRNVLRSCAGYEVIRHDAARPDAPACDGVAKDEIDAGEIFGFPFVEEMFLHGVTAPDEGSE